MALAAWAVVALAAAQPQIRIETPPDGRHRVSVVPLDDAARAALGASEARPRALAVYAGAIGADTPAMAGSYELDGEGLHYSPLFRFSPGVAYTARLRLGALSLERAFQVEAPPSEAPRVLGVSPSGDALPENALRLYVHFSKPMAPRGSTRHVRLLDSDGREVPVAFVEVEGGLWDPARTRLTLFFHPGRVKRGVAPGERMGPPLRAGREYRLVVDGAMADAAGAPLGRSFEHRFRVSAADRNPPAAEGVAVEAPQAPSRPVVVRLPEPLDRGLMERWIWVEDAGGRRLAGRVEVAEGETRWSFTPEEAWSAGSYAVRLERGLEDRAGNRFDRAFDRDPGSPQPPLGEPLRLPFATR